MPKFSIILPVKNGGEYVKACVTSILGQSLEDFQLHVLDNCSTDQTLPWIRSLNDRRIEVVESATPLSIEQNWGRIKETRKNEFMTMIGHDDLLYPGYLSVMNDLVSRHPAAGLYQAHFNYIDQKGGFIRKCLPMKEQQTAADFLADQFTRKIDSTGTGYLMRSADFDRLGGMPLQYPNLIFSDYELWVRLMLKGYKATTEDFCFSYRIHQSVSGRTNGMQYQHAFSLYVEFITQLVKQCPEISKVVDQHGREFLLYYCEAMSHRLLKTRLGQRTMLVKDLVERFHSYASRLIPGQDFEPMKISRIRMAKQLDSSGVGRWLFRLFKKTF